MQFNSIKYKTKFILFRDKKEELMPWQKTKLLKARGGDQSQQIIPDPSESSVHGKEVHVAKQQQTQKEVSEN